MKVKKDVRGYVKEKGWVHGDAHAADGLNELAKCKELNIKELKGILDVVKNKICINDYAYINEEDERMVTAVKSVLKEKLYRQKKL
ncbi:MAG: DUF2785 domain-containing protein [Firmicutes bacterium]|nr:DUF2785 domain-containing protein [Bacillota bacterium]